MKEGNISESSFKVLKTMLRLDICKGKYTGTFQTQF